MFYQYNQQLIIKLSSLNQINDISSVYLHYTQGRIQGGGAPGAPPPKIGKKYVFLA